MRDLLEKILSKKRQIIDIKKNYPLSMARLWTPYCCRFDGLGDLSPRKKGCGQPMTRIQPGIWECKKCQIQERRTSQSDVLMSLGETASLCAGGNRSGKSELACQLAVAVAGGLDAFWVRQWLDLNGLPYSVIRNKKPGNVWISSLSYADSLEYLRPKIDRYLPIGSKKIRWRSQDRGSAILPNGGKITSMSADAGRSKYQGSSVDLVILDEEHPEEIYHESLLRCVDRNGHCFLSMTPLKGLTWVYSAFVEPPIVPRGYAVSRISGLDNPWISSSKLRLSVQHMSEASQKSRLYGQFGSQEGLVYPEFSPDYHISEPFPIPDHWSRYRAIDFGTSHPFCCLWIAHNTDSGRDQLVVYREYYKTNRTTLDNGRIIQRMSENEEYDWTVADPESRDGRLTLMRELEIETIKAPKHIGVLQTINWVKERLQLDADGFPRLVVQRHCKNLIREFRLYSWQKNKGKDAPKKTNDHAMDSIRYAVSAHKRYNMMN